MRHHLGPALARFSSGRELARRGFGRDLEIAADLDAARVVPVLVDGAFVARTWPQPVGHPV